MIFTNQFDFTGQYEDMARLLTSVNGQENPNGVNIFDSGYSCMLYCAAIGIRHGKMSPADEKPETDTHLRVFGSQLSKPDVSDTLKFLFTTAMLEYRGENGELTEDQRIERAFKPINLIEEDDEDKAFTKECEKVFTRYVFGGLEEIYNYFLEEIETRQKNAATITQDQIDRREFKFLRNEITMSADEWSSLSKNS